MNKTEFINSIKRFKQRLIISNDCTAGYIYQFLNKKFNHPFIWNYIDGKDFILLLQNFNNLNYNKFSVVESIIAKDESFSILNRNKWKGTISVTIDDKVNINFIHHHNDNLCKEIKTIKDKWNKNYCGDVYYYDMKNYMKDIYLRRLNRMTPLSDKELLFVINKNRLITEESFYKLLSLHLNHKKVVCIPFDFFINENIKYDKDMTTIIRLPKGISEQSQIAKYLIDNHSEFIRL